MNDSTADGDAQQTPQNEKLNLSTKIAFGAGDLGTAIAAMIGITYLSPFLTDVAGLDPNLAGRTQLIGKVWDAVNDPMVGVLSDRTQSSQGRRYPWMIWGAIPFGIFFFLQWIVPQFSNQESVNEWGLFWYYTAVSILFNAFYTIVNLPYTALTAELTQDYDERTSLTSFRFFFSIGGSIFAILLFLVISIFIPNNRQLQYVVGGAICAVISVLPLYWCVWGTKKRAQAVAKLHPQTEQQVSIPLGQQLKIVFTNRPFLFVVGIYLCSWLSFQLSAGIIPYFVTSWMRLPQWHVSLVLLTVQGTAMSMLFVWTALSKRFGKQAVYYMGMSVWLIAQVGLFFLQPDQIILMYILALMAGFGVSTAYLVPWSMLPDVIELDELKTGQRREGIFYSFMVFLQKICLGFAVYLVLQRLGAAGYIKPTPDIVMPIQPDTVLNVIRNFIGPVPAIALILGLVLTYFYPITREMHSEIILKLKQRQENRGK
ncbi:MAG: MFS transporter [Nostoc sp. ZfuVER08]|jgi:GPH family glycoside/pentoside/hexuronide:cation symporter|uniref:MFS transporter n=1 Tax=Nostoc punctiforme FACHB-252 TaxID=1357509 RepID=A0ABR8HGD6_NOSPU|nr:MFS transporter [Nostoc punctiforme]MBD2614868.1 MFS transporter [Nostoc punctiforme FACHB-252]MBL1199171.1 MFS transporter [Nostoc sp. GBBB01]MDZ8014493.1 MFS transporter [Nostoc sp. ZfuVER08]